MLRATTVTRNSLSFRTSIAKLEHGVSVLTIGKRNYASPIKVHNSPKNKGRMFSTQSEKDMSIFAHRVPSRSDSLVMGCVCYDPSVGDIWSGIKEYLISKGVPFDYVLFTNYEAQVRSLIDGSIDMAWNGPIAHVLTEEMAMHHSPSQYVVSLGMRDVDQDFESVVAVRKNQNIKSINDLNNEVVLSGAMDSPQAHVVPLYHLKSLGITPREIKPFNLDIGKHGDTALGEVEVLKKLASDQKDFSAAILSMMMWKRGVQGEIAGVNASDLSNQFELLDANLPTFDHCQFDALLPKERSDAAGKRLEENLNKFTDAIFEMDWSNDNHRRLMKLEGIQKQWKRPRQTGYTIVRNAMMGGSSHIVPATNLQKRSFSESSLKRPHRVCVVGAGIAGLQTIRSLKARGLEVTAFEGTSNVGGLWQGSYDNFGLQVPKQLFEFPDFPMKDVAWGEFPSGQTVQQYIEQFTDNFSLRESIQFNTKVTEVHAIENSKGEASGGWKIKTQSVNSTTTAITEKEESFDYLVIATGLYSGLNKYIPSFEGTPPKTSTVLHTDDFKDASITKNKRVIVVGGGKSAIDCAVQSSTAGAASVTMLQRNAHWGTPRKIAGLIPFQYIFFSRFGTALVSLHQGTFPNGSGKMVNAFRNNALVRAVMKPVFSIVEAIFAFQLNLKGVSKPTTDVVSDFYGYASVLDNECAKLRKEGKISVQRGEIAKFDDKSVDNNNLLRLKDGTTMDADVVIFGTGFQQADYSMFKDKAVSDNLDLQEDGLYLYRSILPVGVPNLAFIGKVASVSNILTYGLQSEWLARYLTGSLTREHTAPTNQDMELEVKKRKEWAKSFMPKTAGRASLVLLHQNHYHDQLLKDMGVKPSLKGNVVAEYLMPYEPADYNGIIGREIPALN